MKVYLNKKVAAVDLNLRPGTSFLFVRYRRRIYEDGEMVNRDGVYICGNYLRGIPTDRCLVYNQCKISEFVFTY